MRAVIIVEDPTVTFAAEKTLKFPLNIVYCDTNCEYKLNTLSQVSTSNNPILKCIFVERWKKREGNLFYQRFSLRFHF